ncbi:hypothetical protein D3C87_1724180 [compost metagenome]
MIVKLNAIGVAQKKWAAEVRQKVAAAAQEVEKVARAGGLSDEALATIRAKILGIQ